MKRSLSLLLLGSLAFVPVALAKNVKSFWQQAISSFEEPSSITVPATGSIEVAFSPDEGGEQLIVKVIDSAQTEIRLLAYSFTSAPVVEALIKAKKRGVDVALVVDYKANAGGGEEGGKGKSRAALSALVNAGCDVRTISIYAIHHDKVIIVDHKTVELGSFNFSASAAHKNSENVLVDCGNQKLADVYLQHFVRNQKQAEQFKMQY